MEKNIKLSKVGLRPSREDVEKFEHKQKEISKFKTEQKIDPYFLQSIVDRLLGPDAKFYKSEIEKLNSLTEYRRGRVGGDFYEEGFAKSNSNISKTSNSCQS